MQLQSKMLQSTYHQTTYIIEKLSRHCEQGEEWISYLLLASVLFFKTRDLLAFQTIYTSPIYQKLGLSEKLRQLPTLEQLIAILESQRKLPERWATLTSNEQAQAAALVHWGDNALAVEQLRAFRDQLMTNGVPLEGPDLPEAPFPVSPMDYRQVAKQAIAGWDRLQILTSKKYSDGVKFPDSATI